MPILGKTETPWDRMKKTGAMNTGPEHPAMEGVESPEEEQKGPPNLRDALADANICGTCSDFQGMHCGKYDVETKFHQGCDDHSAMREDEAPAVEESDEEMPEEG